MALNYGLPVGGQDFYSDPADELLRRQQEASLQEHNAYAKRLQEMQSQVQLRSQDLDLTKQLIAATSPTTPKPVRNFLLAGISKAVGVDPKGDYSKQLQTMIGSLDPQSLEAMRRSFGMEIPGSSPGSITQNVKAIFSGQIPVTDIVMKVASDNIKVAQMNQPGRATDAPMPGILTERGTEEPRITPPEAGAPQTSQRPSTYTGPTEEQIKRGSAIRRYSQPGETLPMDKGVNPGLLSVLGLDPDPEKQPRLRDVVKIFPGVPPDEKDQAALTKEIQDQNAAAQRAAVSASRLHSLFSGKPEALGVVGGAVRTLESVIDQINGAARLLGAENVDAGKLSGKAFAVSERISKFYRESGIPVTAELSARIQSQVLEMAYDMAIARGIPGNRLTNNIIEQHLNTIGRAASVQQFEAVLKDVTARSLEQGAGVIGQRVGSRQYYHNLQFMSDDELKELVDYQKQQGPNGKSVLPNRFLDAMDKEIEARASGQRKSQAVPLSSPTIAEEAGALQQREADRLAQEERKARTAEQEYELKQSRERREARAETARLDREQRQELESNRRYELQVKKEERMEAQQRRREITEAFARIGAMIAASAGRGSVGGGGGIPGGDQDSSAFRMAPPPTRRAPTPIDASAYQRRVK